MIKIIGAGMAGLLAANMLRRRGPVVYETQRSLPHNHSAVLRFRTNLVGEVLGIPFRKVRVIKHALEWSNPVADALAYSQKVLGQFRTDRSILLGTEVVERWIAPPDLVERMAEGINIKFETEVDVMAEREKVISTIPMPNLAIMLGYKFKAPFGRLVGTTYRAKVRDCDAYVSLYLPSPDHIAYRVSITGDELIAEVGPGLPPKAREKRSAGVMNEALYCLGLGGRSRIIGPISIHHTEYAKIAPMDETERRDFIHWASAERGKAFSLGRYATWRPGLLLDDLVKDVRTIDGWIDDKYGMDVHRSKR